MKHDIYRIYDSSLWVDLTDESPHLPKGLYHRVLNFLRSRGFEFRPDEMLRKKNPRSWAWQRCVGSKGDLHLSVEVTGRDNKAHAGKISLEFWQNIVLEAGRSSGRHSFDKRQRMPYLIRLQWQATINALGRFLAGLGIEYQTTNWQHAEMRGMPFIHQRMAESLHTPKGYHPLTYTSAYSYNTQGADKQPVQPGTRYQAYVCGRLVTGIAYYHINNMWWLLPNENSRPYNIGSHRLHPMTAKLPRREKLPQPEALEKVQRVYKAAQSREQWLRCHAISQFLKSTQAA